jgi:hypothetical protein
VTARDGVTDRATGAGGVIVQVARLTWLHGAAADVVGGYYITHRHAAGLRYRVEPQGHDWAVTTVHLLCGRDARPSHHPVSPNGARRIAPFSTKQPR